MLKKYSLIITAIYLFMSAQTNAQQEVQNSLYMFNPIAINPAYAGSRDAISGVLDYRHQWVKFDGAPVTTMISLHSPIKEKSLAIGLNVMNDKIGATNNTAIYADVAYKIRLNKKNDKLSFGLKMGGDYFTATFNQLRVTDVNDQTQNINNYSKFLLNIGAGVYYYGKKHYLGFAIPKLVQNQKVDISNFKSKQVLHYYFIAGYVYKLNSMVDFKPSLQIKYTQNAPISAEINTSFLLVDKFWIGAMYRHNAAVGLNFMYQISETLRAGYAYDYSTTSLMKVSPSSHEIMIGFDLTKTKASFKTPRYF